MRLALALGISLSELDAMPAREVTEWELFQREEPIGEERMDYRFARITAMYANAHREKLAPARPMSEFTWLPELNRKPADRSRSGLELAAMMGAKL